MDLLAPPDLHPPTMDLADEVKGMYRVVELITESSGNGTCKEPYGTAPLVFTY